MTMSDKQEILGIGQIAIAVSDIKKAIDFYKNKLGLNLLFEVPSGMAFFECGGIRLMVTEQNGDLKDHKTSVIYYHVLEIKKTAKSMLERGVKFTKDPHMAVKMPDHELWIGFLRDPDENLIGIMEEVPLSV
jgi:catechol 2,3-dioxygenase-like lactoylglutathione lyase family enzyme